MAGVLPELVELHDSAVFNGIRVSDDAEVTLELRNVTAYFKTQPLRFEVWSCAASLTIRQCYEIHLVGMIGRGPRIIDGEIYGPNRLEIEIATLLSGFVEIEMVEILFQSGANLTCKGRTIGLLGLERVLRLRDWYGPLG